MRVAIIPARGGSKGVPRKNLRMVAGKPLVAWCIEAAKQAKTVDVVYVSTDDDEIATVSEGFGAEVIRRPKELASDESSSESALLHAISQIEAQGIFPDEIVFMQCTSPLTSGDDVDSCVRKLESCGADSAFTAKEFFYFIWKINQDGSCEGVNHDKRSRPRRQDRDAQYEENGAVYVMRTAGFKEAKHRFFGKTVISLMPEERCFEIDTETDLKFADLLLGHGRKTLPRRLLPDEVNAIIFDFDGVFTDDCVWTSEDGVECVKCSRADGQGIARAKTWGVPMLILSTEENPVVTARAHKLGLEVIQNAGLCSKAAVMKQWLSDKGISPTHVVFVGNDLNDVECMKSVGFAMAPASAARGAKDAADVVLAHKGGDGAIRECLEYIAEKCSWEF